MEHTATIGHLVVRSREGQPASDGYAEVEHRSEIRARVTDCAGLRPAQTIVFFREGAFSRTLTLCNDGPDDVAVTHVLAPQGYRASPAQGVVPAKEGNRPGTLELAVEREVQVPAANTSKLVIVEAGGVQHAVQLSMVQHAGLPELRPTAIVGVDLGTTFTSIAFRECRYHDDKEDDVHLLCPMGYEGMTRFPTYIWLERCGSLRYGEDARSAYRTDPGRGHLYTETKGLLRDPEAVVAWPLDGAVEDAIAALGDQWWRELVARYLGWIRTDIVEPELERRFGTTAVPVQYVFSLPVLDYALNGSALYGAQRRSMEHCVRAARYPEDLEHLFPFEPQCAALALLHPRSDWPELNAAEHPVNEDAKLAVLDSGGGTTDVAVMKLGIDDRARLRVEVLGCLGVDAQGFAFGGEHVTREMLKLLLIEASKALDGTDYVGTLTRRAVLGPELQSVERGLDIHDEMNRIKGALSGLSSEAWLDLHDDLKLSPAILERICRPELESLGQSLFHTALSSIKPGDVDYYMVVGGNGRLAAVADWWERLMGATAVTARRRRLNLPAEDIQLAVAYGTVWTPTPQVRNPLPMELRLELTAGADGQLVRRELWSRNSAIETHHMPRQFPVAVQPGTSLRIKVVGSDGQAEGTIGEAVYVNEDHLPVTVSISCRLEAQRMEVALNDRVLLRCAI